MRQINFVRRILHSEMKNLISIVLFHLPIWVMGQHVDSLNTQIARLNQEIDNAVVEKNIAFLKKHYSEDFVFTHGTGMIDDKTRWINSVKNPASIFLSRQHDSTTVEIHNDIAIVTGKLLVIRQDENKNVNYGLRYVRVFRKENETWQLISHRTTFEWHY